MISRSTKPKLAELRAGDRVEVVYLHLDKIRELTAERALGNRQNLFLVRVPGKRRPVLFIQFLPRNEDAFLACYMTTDKSGRSRLEPGVVQVSDVSFVDCRMPETISKQQLCEGKPRRLEIQALMRIAAAMPKHLADAFEKEICYSGMQERPARR